MISSYYNQDEITLYVQAPGDWCYVVGKIEEDVQKLSDANAIRDILDWYEKLKKAK